MQRAALTAGAEARHAGRIVGGVLGSAIGRTKGNHPVAGAVIGAGALFAARRLFPQRYAAMAAWAAAGYLTKKWTERAEARQAAEAAHAIDPQLAQAGVVDSSNPVRSNRADSTSNAVNFEPLFVPEPGKTLTITYFVACIP